MVLLAFQLAGLSFLAAPPKAHALFWEDDFDGNDPAESKKRPKSFFLTDWIEDLNKDAKTKGYQDKDNRDKGPEVNSEARALVIIASGVVGLGAGLLVANRLSGDGGDVGADMFIGGALGLVAGVGIGALIMPKNYDVDPHAKADFLKYRQAWNEDPIRIHVAQAFHQPQASFLFQF